MIITLETQQIHPDIGQPRQEFDGTELAALKASIATIGIQQPLLVRCIPDGTYRIVDGERRWRAATELGIPTVPCVIIEESDLRVIHTRQLAANVLRQNLTPLEDAQGLYRLWLLYQVQAWYETTTQGLEPPSLDETDSIVEHIRTLEAQVCELSGKATMQEYAHQPAVPWQVVLEAVGRGDWSADRRRRHLAVVHTLDPVVQEVLAGMPVSQTTLNRLAKLPTDEQRTLTDTALLNADGTGDVGAALREVLPSQTPAAASQDQTGYADVDQPDPFLSLGREKPDTFTPDPSLALPTGTSGIAPKMKTDGPEPGRGSTPPSDHAFWSQDALIALTGALEAVLHTCEQVAPGASIGEQDRPQVQVLWDEVQERLAQAGLVQ